MALLTQPNDILDYLTKFLNVYTRAQLLQTSKRFHQVVSNSSPVIYVNINILTKGYQIATNLIELFKNVRLKVRLFDYRDSLFQKIKNNIVTLQVYPTTGYNAEQIPLDQIHSIPNLHRLVIIDHDLVKPELFLKLPNLHCLSLSTKFGTIDGFENMVNLKRLDTIVTYNGISDEEISKLPRLKQLHLVCLNGKYMSYIGNDSYPTGEISSITEEGLLELPNLKRLRLSMNIKLSPLCCTKLCQKGVVIRWSNIKYNIHNRPVN